MRKIMLRILASLAGLAVSDAMALAPGFQPPGYATGYAYPAPPPGWRGGYVPPGYASAQPRYPVPGYPAYYPPGARAVAPAPWGMPPVNGRAAPARPAAALPPADNRPAPVSAPEQTPKAPVSQTLPAPSGEASGKNADKTAKQGEQKKGDAKQAFFAKLRPLIKAENDRLLGVRDELEGLLDKLEAGVSLNDRDQDRLQSLAKKYRVDGDPLEEAGAREELIKRIDIIPMSLALAQAANESAWGKSRFAREGNNLFGIWTYDESKGIVPKKRPAGAKHLVRKFDSLAESVRYYMLTLNSHPAYDEMRDLRHEHRRNNVKLAGKNLAKGLKAYSAKGDAYIGLIRDLIDRHELSALDGIRTQG